MSSMRIGSGRSRVKDLPNRQKISDQGILDLMREGKWDTQIRQMHKVGIHRLRRIRRENKL